MRMIERMEILGMPGLQAASSSGTISKVWLLSRESSWISRLVAGTAMVILLRDTSTSGGLRDSLVERGGRGHKVLVVRKDKKTSRNPSRPLLRND